MRLDVYLVKNNYFKSRQKAKEAIKSGFVFSNGKKVTKPATEDYGDITLSDKVLKYVSRAGLKLEKAINHYHLDFKDKVVLDVGASTGGFTDCAIKYGASKVYAVDVGTNQLANSLKNDPRVLSYEKTNVLAFNSDQAFDYILCDVSFVSLKKLLKHLYNLYSSNYILLVKPQFETGGLYLEKGIVKDNKIRQKVVRDIKNYAIKLGFRYIGVTSSPIKGSHGNKEYLMYLKKDENYAGIVNN